MQTLPDPLWSTLRTVAQALNGAAVEWRLGGSALLAIVGVDVEVNDLDVTVAPDALEEVAAACGDWIRGVHVGDAPPPWCSDWLVKLRLGHSDVDVIGGFCLHGAAGRTRIPQDVGGVLEVDGVEVPLADPAVWWWIYRSYRPAKAQALAEVLPPARLRAIEDRLEQR